jgi:hypothetical protein
MNHEDVLLHHMFILLLRSDEMRFGMKNLIWYDMFVSALRHSFLTSSTEEGDYSKPVSALTGELC